MHRTESQDLTRPRLQQPRSESVLPRNPPRGKLETFLKCRCTNYSCQERQWHFVIKSYVYFPLLNTHTLVFPERGAYTLSNEQFADGLNTCTNEIKRADLGLLVFYL